MNENFLTSGAAVYRFLYYLKSIVEVKKQKRRFLYEV